MARRNTGISAEEISGVIEDILNELIDQYYFDLVESEEDYEKILHRIYREFRKTARQKGVEVADYLREMKEKHRGRLKLILSYLIATTLKNEMEARKYASVLDTSRL